MGGYRQKEEEAELDIKQLLADGVLEKVGYRKQTIYVLKK